MGICTYANSLNTQQVKHFLWARHHWSLDWFSYVLLVIWWNDHLRIERALKYCHSSALPLLHHY